jgi:hypothetical protein
VLIISAVFGVASIVLVLVHEAIPLLFGLGVIAVLVVLANQLERKALWVSCILALGPGLVTAGVVAVLGKHGVGQELCALIPHVTINWPATGNPSIGDVLRGFRFNVDYHDWLCRNILPLYDQGFGDAVSFVASIGVLALAASTVFGIALLAVTVLAISHISGVPFSRMRSLLRDRIVWVLIGFALILPVFMTGVDWTRWWVLIAFDVGIVFLIFASSEPDSELPVTRRTRIVFALGAVLLALLPLGIIPGFGAPLPV